MIIVNTGRYQSARGVCQIIRIRDGLGIGLTPNGKGCAWDSKTGDCIWQDIFPDTFKDLKITKYIGEADGN